ncbi:MAG: hypothetical protein U9N02_07595 [Campylobacterota bacterium]|nr:hypothetical protein [Campylobacterota bacterium]
MKISISRQNLYLLVLSVFLLIFVLLFSFIVLIPQGKEYREKRTHIKKKEVELKVLKNYNNDTTDILKTLKTKNKHIVYAFENTFEPERFKELHGGYFSKLTISKGKKENNIDDFSVYSIEASSKIDSPKTFYNFLDSVNKTEWIISVNFPITFKREGDLINSSFTIKVYSNPDDLNSSR